MANSVLQACCLIVLTIFVERGDGRWKKKEGSLQHDIELFRKMADKIEDELEDTYDEYSSRLLEEQILDSLPLQYRRNAAKAKNDTIVKSKELYASPINFNNIVNKDVPQNHIEEENTNTDAVTYMSTHWSNTDKLKAPRWPKFEDMLLAVGKKYDWKNDRWIKVKGKLKETDIGNINDNSIEFHEKHKFHYKIVKLNKSKSRRNVVVAVSAVR